MEIRLPAADTVTETIVATKLRVSESTCTRYALTYLAELGWTRTSGTSIKRAYILGPRLA